MLVYPYTPPLGCPRRPHPIVFENPPDLYFYRMYGTVRHPRRIGGTSSHHHGPQPNGRIAVFYSCMWRPRRLTKFIHIRMKYLCTRRLVSTYTCMYVNVARSINHISHNKTPPFQQFISKPGWCSGNTSETEQLKTSGSMPCGCTNVHSKNIRVNLHTLCEYSHLHRTAKKKSQVRILDQAILFFVIIFVIVDGSYVARYRSDGTP